MTKTHFPATATLAALILAVLALPAGSRPAIAAGPVTIATAYTTGYTWFDNSPPGADICCGVIHSKAGGTGTYPDPITLAAGLVSSHVLDYPPGTRFYMPDVRRYFIVEDSCGNVGSGGCHFLDNAPPGATTWVDRWVGGTAGDAQGAVQGCADYLTDDGGRTPLHTLVENPPPGLAVVAGPLFQNGQCTAVYGNGPAPAAGPASTPTPTPPPVAAATPTPTSTPSPPAPSAAPTPEPTPSLSISPTSALPTPAPSPPRSRQQRVAAVLLPALSILALILLAAGGAWAWRRQRRRRTRPP